MIENLSEDVFTCNSFKVERVIERGDREQFYVVVQGATGIIALDDQNRILLTREYRPKTGQVHWRIPAGKVEPGETMLQTAHRELREESGYDATEMELFFDLDSGARWLKYPKTVFIARGIFPSPLDTGDEEIQPEVFFKEPKEVLQLLFDGEIAGTIASALYRYLHVNNLF